MINGQQPTDEPPADFFNMYRQLIKIGNNLNQLTQAAHRFGSIHAARLDETLNDLKKTSLSIFEKVMSPVPVDIPTTLEQGRLQAEKEKVELLPKTGREEDEKQNQ